MELLEVRLARDKEIESTLLQAEKCLWGVKAISDIPEKTKEELCGPAGDVMGKALDSHMVEA